jgi:hypothetical protein
VRFDQQRREPPVLIDHTLNGFSLGFRAVDSGYSRFECRAA